MPDSAIDPQYEGLLETALQNCAAERIHEIGTIQPAGVLLAVDQDLHVRMASDNLAGLFGIAAGDALGRALAELVGAAQAETIRTFAAQESWSGSQICSISLDRDGADTRFDARLVHSDGLLVIEIENQPSGTEDAFHLQFVPIRDSLWKLDAEQDMQRYSQAVVDEVRLLSGYDRVMMYRFDYNWDGEVIAESRIDGALSYLGNHFPASDIPAQARELYTRNLVRLISDVDGESIPVLGDTPAAKPLDLSQSWLRSMSPVHVQYLRNMGVQASLSISLVQNNRLWGLIACHHLSPKYVSLRTREMNEFIARMVSLKLGKMENDERGMLHDRIRALLQGLTDSLQQDRNLDAVLRSCEDEFLGIVRASGAVLSIGGVRHRLGQTLDDIKLDLLLEKSQEQRDGRIFCTDDLSRLLPLDPQERDIASGMMLALHDRGAGNFVMWFRPAILRTLRWAGRPEKQIFRDENGRLHISPRQSFDTWMETSGDRSVAWSKVEIDSAGTLSLALIELMAQRALKLSEASYKLLADNSTDLIARLDANGRFVFVSPASMELFGCAPDEMLGRALTDWALADDHPAIAKVLGDLARQHGQDTALFRCRRKDGASIWVEATFKRMHGLAATEEIVVNARDVTRRHTYQLAIEEVHRRNAKILDATGEGLLSLDRTGHILYANELAAKMLGSAPGELAGKFSCELIYGSPLSEEQKAACPFLKTLHDGETRQGTLALPAAGLISGQVQFICSPLMESQSTVGAVLVLRNPADAPEQDKHPATDVILEQAVEAVMITNAQGVITAINRAFTEITGFTAEEAVGQTPRIMKSGVHTPHFYQGFWDSLLNKHRWSGEIWNRRKNGEIFPLWGSVTAIVGSDGAPQTYVSVFSDISKAKQAEEKLHYLANYDPLTGLPNRMRFTVQLDEALNAIRRENSNAALVFIDIDHFKLVNDSLGHAAGDTYLRTIAERLQQACANERLLSRWGGDEFVMLMRNAGDRESVGNVMTLLQQDLRRIIQLEGHQLVPTISIGISLFPEDGGSASDLIKAADAAMYRAKESGRNRFAFFTEVMSREIREKFSIAAELRRALREQELVLYYQPQIHAVTGRLHGVEALVRWQHPSRGLMPPSMFIPIAEEQGLVEEVGNWVLGQACRQISDWHSRGIPVPRVAVNVAPAQLTEGFVSLVEQTVAAAGLAPSCLEIEITEGALEAAESVRAILRRLREMQFLLSVDDFGTGYSSLSHIKLFPITCFKIDKSFIDGLPGNPMDVAIVRAILTLGESLGLEIVAEGVETRAQFEFLRDADVTSIQGYYFSRPMDADALAEFARTLALRDQAGDLKEVISVSKLAEQHNLPAIRNDSQ